MAFRVRMVAAVCAFVFAVVPSANASEPLTSISVFNGGGFAPCPQMGPVDFFIGHDADIPLPPYDPVVYGQGLRLWNSGESGQFEINPANEPRFADLASVLTNGRDDMVWFLTGMLPCAPLNGGSGGPESIVFSEGHDLAGNQLDFIRLYVSNVNIEVLDPTIQWVAWTADVTYEFWGMPLPEPAITLPILLTVLLWCHRLRKRSL